MKSSLLKSEDLWLLEEGHCLRHQVLDVCSLRKNEKGKRRFNFESGSLETLKNLVDSIATLYSRRLRLQPWDTLSSHSV